MHGSDTCLHAVQLLKVLKKHDALVTCTTPSCRPSQTSYSLSILVATDNNGGNTGQFKSGALDAINVKTAVL